MIILKKIINFLIYFLIKIKFLALPKKSLRVLMFHNISDVTNFENQIELLKAKIKETLRDLSNDKKVILIYPTPVSPVNILQHITKKKNEISKNNDFYLEDKINYSKNFYRKYYSEIIDLFDQINFNNVYKIKLEKVFCPENKCIFYDDTNAYIFDTQHPSYEGSKKINNLILEKINMIESRSN